MEHGPSAQALSSIHSRLAELSQSASDTPAIIDCHGQPISYGELWKGIQRAASFLKSNKVSANDCIAIVIPEGPSTAVGFLSISAVAACAPLNPAYTREDFIFYLEDLKPKAVVIPSGYVSPVIAAAEATNTPIWHVDPDQLFEFIDDEPNETPSDCLPPESSQTALILHTSGTTSRPKMVPLTHANLATSAFNVASTLRLTTTDRALNVMPLFHIHGIVAGLLGSLVSGGSVICTPGFDSSRFMHWASALKPSWYSAVPTIHQAILDQLELEPDLADQIPWRLIRSSSAALPPVLFEAMERRWKTPVIESYGMTEAAHQMASNQLPPGKRKPGSVGRPDGPEIVIVDDHGQALPAGETGEITIRGANVITSYLANPEATQSSYFGPWFRTGDKGRIDEDGYIFIVGRIKEMINRGGENVAPREIDEVLLQHPSVMQAVAFAVPHSSLGEDIAAAVVLKKNHEVPERTLRDYLHDKLAPFKIPSRIITINEIPKGPTGKIQRIGLYEKLKSSFETSFSPPSTDTEKAVIEIISEVLKQDHIGLESNFFYLGGDSLKAVRTTAKLNEAFSIQMPPGMIFRYPTPQLIAEQILQHLAEDEEIQELADDLKNLTIEEIDALLKENPHT